MSRMPLHLFAHPEDLAIVRLAPDEEPAFAWRTGPLQVLARSNSETSVVTLREAVPASARSEGPFRALEVAGPLDFAMVGVLASILSPVAAVGLTALTVSTFDTDWVLIRSEDIDVAIDALRKADQVVTPTSVWSGETA